MNEFTVKKVAEVQAFLHLGSAIVSRGGRLYANQMPQIVATLSSLDPDISGIVRDPTSKPLFEQKTQKTLAKLTQMMNLYIGDNWDDPVEILEWLSFYSGSASAHADLAASALGASGLTDEQAALQDISSDFWQLLKSIKQHLQATGASRAAKP